MKREWEGEGQSASDDNLRIGRLRKGRGEIMNNEGSEVERKERGWHMHRRRDRLYKRERE